MKHILIERLSSCEPGGSPGILCGPVGVQSPPYQPGFQALVAWGELERSWSQAPFLRVPRARPGQAGFQDLKSRRIESAGGRDLVYSNYVPKSSFQIKMSFEGTNMFYFPPQCFPSLKKVQLPSLSKLPFKSIDHKFMEKSKNQLNKFLQVSTWKVWIWEEKWVMWD